MNEETVNSAEEIKYIVEDLPFVNGVIKEATYKGVSMQIAVNEPEGWISIYLVKSENEGQGEVQEMIELLKKDWPDKKLFASVPMNDTIKHIFDKHGIGYENEDEYEKDELFGDEIAGSNPAQSEIFKNNEG